MLRVDHLVKSYAPEKKSRRARKAAGEPERAPAVDDVSLEVEEGALYTLLGPSGCGKTTTLRSIAGLETPDSGRITVDDRVLFSAEPGGRAGAATVNVEANERRLGMVFQSYAIWPHMTVFDNVAFPLQIRRRAERPSKSEIEASVRRALDVMELGHLAERSATKLSGGQQQRLALARAVVTEPRVLLLDEPLSNLDAKLRESLRLELKRLQSDLGITSIYVTHDQDEALSLSSTIAVMRAGKVVQTGRPRDIYAHPSCRFVAEFIGTSNFFGGTVAAQRDGWVHVDTAAGPLRMRRPEQALPPGAEVIVSVRPEDVELAAASAGGAVPNEWAGRVLTQIFLGDTIDHVVAVGGLEIRNRSTPATSLPAQSDVFLRIDPRKVSLVPVE
ncbi:ABC transporter ATP-binding protein [Streptomyces sp. NPDC050560]|uniref:ABC transporter ATP-binding protein n=1 Tax=Streptomyces sp. NPDC050560 TaxID=3365630 RepID=UPI0037B5E471